VFHARKTHLHNCSVYLQHKVTPSLQQDCVTVVSITFTQHVAHFERDRVLTVFIHKITGKMRHILKKLSRL